MDPKQRQFEQNFVRMLDDLAEEARREANRLQVLRIKFMLGEIDYDPDECNYN